MATDQRRQRVDVFGRFLHEEKLGPLALDKRRHVFDGGAGEPQQVPAYDFHIVLMVRA